MALLESVPLIIFKNHNTSEEKVRTLRKRVILHYSITGVELVSQFLWLIYIYIPPLVGQGLSLDYLFLPAEGTS